MKLRSSNSIDLFKFIMAVAIMAMHIEPFMVNQSPILYVIYYCFLSCAVPFFFMATGFLLECKMCYSADRLKVLDRYIFKTLKLYLFFVAIDFCIELVLGGIVSFSSIGLFAYSAFVRCHLTYNFPLWYLMSIVYSLLLVRFLYTIKYQNKVLAVGVVLFLFSVWLCKDRILMHQKVNIDAVADYARLLRGLFYISVGMLLTKRDISSYFCVILIITGITLNMVLGVGEDYDLMIPIFSIPVFMLVLRLKLPDSNWFLYFRDMSKVIFLSHAYLHKLFGFGLQAFILSVVFVFVFGTLFWYLKGVRRKQC